MTSVRHPDQHPGDEVLLAYASGALGAGWDLAIAVHLALCPSCRARATDYESLGGAALDDAAPEALHEPVDIAALIERADAVEEKRPAAPPSGGAPVFPEPLRSLTGDQTDIRWSPVGGGVRQKIVLQDGGVVARLLHIAPGVAVPEHGHRGLEMTAVLSGGYYDGRDAFQRGDIQVVAHEGPHKPVAMKDAPCVCLVVTDAPVRFRGLLPRLLQPFMKI